jgi:hypothetical protein
MLNGVPVICSERGGMPEMVGTGGIVVRFDGRHYEQPWGRVPGEEEVAQLGELVVSLRRDTQRYEHLVGDQGQRESDTCIARLAEAAMGSLERRFRVRGVAQRLADALVVERLDRMRARHGGVGRVDREHLRVRHPLHRRQRGDRALVLHVDLLGGHGRHIGGSVLAEIDDPIYEGSTTATLLVDDPGRMIAV